MNIETIILIIGLAANIAATSFMFIKSKIILERRLTKLETVLDIIAKKFKIELDKTGN